MFAIIEVGAKQLKVKKGDIIQTETIQAKEGKPVHLDKVLLISDKSEIKVGRPYIKGAKVDAEVIGHFKSKKVVSYKYKRRKSSHWKKGHRQQLTRLKVKEITA
ncbi:MAG: 50S ribosomal protein L21 [Candidatus Omnitrophica bacterium]|nr:50S ribosomal protein L21 [Candidatus Omnitrophota bacterium]